MTRAGRGPSLNVLTVERLSFNYPHTTAAPASPHTKAPASSLAQSQQRSPVLADISFILRAGEWVVLLGATGSGKSTLCGILLNLIPAMTGGTLTGTVTLASNHALGYVFQDAEAQLFNMTVEDEIAFGLETAVMTRGEMRARVREWLGWARLDGLDARAPWQLSGGQKKRLALASVLAMSPSVLVLDEPTAGLDPQGVAEVCESLNDLRRRGEHTLFIATSDVELSTRYADRALVLADGRIAQEGPLDTLWTQPDSPASKIGIPQIVALARELQRRDESAEFVTLDQATKVLTADGRRRTAVVQRGDGRQQAVDGGQMTDHGQLSTAVESSLRGNDVLANASLQPPSAVRRPSSDLQLPVGSSRSPSPVIAVEHLTFHYPDAGLALRDVSFEIARGSFVAILGANGSGKTTLAKHLNGLLRPQAGRVLLNGEDIAKRTTAELAHQMGYVFQNPDHQLFAATVREEIMFGLQNLALPAENQKQRLVDALAAFELESLAEMPPATLGYGARRLVTLAAIWAMSPDVWVMDEPTTGLDAHHADRVLQTACEAQARGATIILISHDIPRVAANAQRALVMRDGSLLADATPRDIFGDAALLREARLTAPPITELAHRLGWKASPLTVDEWLAVYPSTTPKGDA